MSIRNSLRAPLLFALMLVCGMFRAAAQTPTMLPLVNGDFEQQLQGWKIAPDEGMTTLSTEQAASGKYSLKVVDDSDKQGSSAFATRVAIPGAGNYALQGKAFPVSGNGLGIYVRVLDKNGQVVGQGDDFQRAAPTQPTGKWVPFSIDLFTGHEAAFLEVWIHSYGAAKVTAYLDDFVFTRSTQEAKPPWQGTYKIKPHEKSKLTAADVVGPDGIVYPDWRYAGVPGGIPNVRVVARAAEFGALADDERDDSAALEKAADEVGRRGGGALLLAAGTYYLDRPITIARDNVVIRGAGAGKTKILFRYAAPASGVGFFNLQPNATITNSSWIEAHAKPDDLQSISILLDGQQIAQAKNYEHWGATFSLRTGASNILSKAPSGEHTLTAVAEYLNGRKIESSIPIRTDAAATSGEERIPSQLGAINFVGVSRFGQQIKLARDGLRGERELLLESNRGIAKGDRIRIMAPATPRWNALVRNAAPWGAYRRYEFLVEEVTGNTVRLNQPLRIEFPVIDGAYVQEISPIRRSGIEDLYLEQTQDLWTSGIIFSNAWECWARGVTVKKAGRFPLYFLGAKWGEIRDCVLDDAWFKGGGGTAYAGWEYSCDGLMENVTTFKLRHAPLVQWSASGNVIRKSTFHESDGQWHSGWTNENLFAQCVIESRTGNGAYGYGMWGSPPEDAAHGPNGPRNVVYNCDVRSPKAGLWMGGMNENWLILHNRFVVGSGPGVFMKTASFDHIIKGNVFQLTDTKQPAVQLATPDCIGVELIDNRVLGGNGKLSGGLARPLVQSDNVFAALPAQGDAPRPQPAVPSIFEWQRKAGKAAAK